MDALNNPKEFLSKEDKRLRQLQDKLGIDEKEISQVPSEKKLTNKVAATTSNHSQNQNSGEGSNGAGKKTAANSADQNKKGIIEF